MGNRVVITGMGCISPLGNDVETLWKNLLAGKSGVSPITHYDSSEFKTHFAAEVKDFNGSALFGSKEARPDGSFHPVCARSRPAGGPLQRPAAEGREP